MKSIVIRSSGAAALAGTLALAVACSEDRNTFREEGSFIADAGTPEAAVCGFQCSLDGRSIVNTCTGETVETCADDLACGAAKCQEPCAAAAADWSSTGCEFYTQMPRYRYGQDPQSCFAAFIVNTSNKPVDVELAWGDRALDTSKSLYRALDDGESFEPYEGPLQPGDGAVLFIADRPDEPATSIDAIRKPCPHNVVPAVEEHIRDFTTGYGQSFRITTNAPVSAMAMYPFGGAQTYLPQATLLYPVASWGKQHIIVNGWEQTFTGSPGLQLVASEEDTEVTIDPVVALNGGGEVAGTLEHQPVTYTLKKGQFLQLLQGTELTGSTVFSNKPTSIFGGHQCAYVPTEVSACEILSQQLPSYDQWGNEYVGVGYRPRLGNEHEPVYYRIVAARSGTRLDYDPYIPAGAPTELSAGEAVIFPAGTGDAFVVRTQDVDHPVYVAQYMTGGSEHGGSGDAEFVNVIPAGQYLNSYGFYADKSFAETSLVIVRAKAADGQFKPVWLDCAGDLDDFTPIGSRGQYEFRRVDLSRGRHAGEKFGDKACTTGVRHMRSEGPFTATVWGWDHYASYAYPGGSAQRTLVTTPLAEVR